MKSNWKKYAKYLLTGWLLLTMIAGYWSYTELHTMYGKYTQVVDDSIFTPEDGPVVINNISILSENGEVFNPNQSIYIKDGRIISIDSTDLHLTQVTTIDGTGKYLIPGLIDAHVHLFESPNDLLLYVANGVTQIRELIGAPNHLRWKQEIAEGRIGPDMYVATPRLGSFGKMQGLFMKWSQGFANIQDAEQAEAAITKFQAQGYDGIKIYSHLNNEAYKAVSEAATKLDMDMMGHIPWSVNMSEVYRSKQSDVAHIEEIMNALNSEFGHYDGSQGDDFKQFVKERCETVADSLLYHNITVTSTLWGTANIVRHKYTLDKVLNEVQLNYLNPGISEGSKMASRAIGWLPDVNRMRLPNGLTPEEIEGRKTHWQIYADVAQQIGTILAQRGVTILAGTDANIAPAVPGFSLHDELESLNGIGMSPAQVLRSTTANTAAWLKTPTGEITIGNSANLLILDKNPLEDIGNTRSINTVILKGKVYDRGLLDDMLAAVKEANDQSREVDISKYER